MWIFKRRVEFDELYFCNKYKRRIEVSEFVFMLMKRERERFYVFFVHKRYRFIHYSTE